MLDGVIPLLGRVLLSAIFLISGVGKLAAPATTIGYITMSGLPFPTLAYALAAFTEIVGGLALVLGFRTRWGAGALALFSIATAFGFHAHFADQNKFIHFFKNVAMAGGSLQIVAFGAEAISLDARKG